jgi:putative long chain acyl-CoA synthase
VRLFIGSGMPRGLWRRVAERFAPASVLEFYASTEGDAVLVNLTGSKPGSKGRPLPGSAEVRIAAYDAESGALEEGPDGFAIACARGETGMLVARAGGGAAVATSDTPLRGLFEPGDAWLQTGDLFRRDVDGDYWLVAHSHALVRTPGGMTPTIPVEDALGDVDAVDIVTAYGVPAGDHEEVVAAVTLRNGKRLGPKALTSALSGLGEHERPAVVRVVDEIPVTTWYRPSTGTLRKEGIPKPGKGVKAWYWNPDRRTYAALTAAARTRLLGG